MRTVASQGNSRQPWSERHGHAFTHAQIKRFGLAPSLALGLGTPTRFAAFFWVESMVRDDGRRRLLLDFDRSVQEIAGAMPDSPAVAQLYSVYHNLLRQWADT